MDLIFIFLIVKNIKLKEHKMFRRRLSNHFEELKPKLEYSLDKPLTPNNLVDLIFVLLGVFLVPIGYIFLLCAFSTQIAGLMFLIAFNITNNHIYVFGLILIASLDIVIFGIFYLSLKGTKLSFKIT